MSSFLFLPLVGTEVGEVIFYCKKDGFLVLVDVMNFNNVEITLY